MWNDPLDSEKSREMLEEIILPGQASVFNGCCRVYAPLYRQATIGAFFAERDEAAKAFSIAFDDVERAFETFIREHNVDRPFILAAHSQGSMHAMGLLERIDADPALRARMVAAYIPGFAHPSDRYGTVYKHLKPCDSPAQTGCVASWDSYREDKEPDGADPLLYWSAGELASVPVEASRQCTNPVTWRSDERPSPPEAHLGAVKKKNDGNAPSFWKTLLSKDSIGMNVTGLEPARAGLFSARCENGVLRVPDLDDVGYEAAETSPGNYHLVDYELFYMDIRANARLRTDAWQKANSEPSNGSADAAHEPENR